MNLVTRLLRRWRVQLVRVEAAPGPCALCGSPIEPGRLWTDKSGAVEHFLPCESEVDA